jgi:hypothetical protein
VDQILPHHSPSPFDFPHTTGIRFFAEHFFSGTRQRGKEVYLPSVKKKTLGKDFFVECQSKTLGKEHSAKKVFVECFFFHSAKQFFKPRFGALNELK